MPFSKGCWYLFSLAALIDLNGTSAGDLYFVPSGHSNHLNCHHLFNYHSNPEQVKASQPLKYTSLSKISQNVNCHKLSALSHTLLFSRPIPLECAMYSGISIILLSKFVILQLYSLSMTQYMTRIKIPNQKHKLGVSNINCI